MAHVSMPRGCYPPHHSITSSARRQHGCSRPIAEITALSRQKETSEGAESRAKISHWLCRASNVLQNPFTGTKPMAMFLCFILQIAARYVFNYPLGWTVRNEARSLSQPQGAPPA